MRPKWDYRSVEGVLYGLGSRLAERQSQHGPRQAVTPPPARPMTPREARATFEVTRSLRRSLDEGELKEVAVHYIYGVRRRDGREGYRRREAIIKKLVSHLNEGFDGDT